MPKLFEPWPSGNPFPLKVDYRWQFIERFIRFKMHTDKEPPRSWQELADWIQEFDNKRNEADIEMQKIFEEHMLTCIRPIIVSKHSLEQALKE